jgi:DNA-binding MarR family transcriptional regulator
MSKKHKTLKEEIQQSMDFSNLEAEVYLNLLRTTEALGAEVNAILRQFSLSQSQYNVLRILRGAGEQGLCGRDIVERMVTRDSDMTRLLDGLEKKKLVKRTRSDEDRRIIMANITKSGFKLLTKMDKPMAGVHKTQLRHLSEAKLTRLNRLLEEARQGE